MPFLVCGFNPNFEGFGNPLPATCLGFPILCGDQTTAGQPLDNGIPASVTMTITAGYPTALTAQIVNCQIQPSIDKGASCIPSDDSGNRPLSHELTWGKPNGNTGPVATLTLTQEGTSDDTTYQDENLPPKDWPGQWILITDSYGNADLVFFNVTSCATSPDGTTGCK
jgi:hypothetical protein